MAHPYPSLCTDYDIPGPLSYINHIQTQVDRHSPGNKGKPQISCRSLADSVMAEYNIGYVLFLIGYWEEQFKIM
jgi:hypothetical protein